MIVGSAIVKLIGEHGKNSAEYVGEYVASMKKTSKDNIAKRGRKSWKKNIL